MGDGSEFGGQVSEGFGWYLTLLKSSTVVSTGGVFQYSSRPRTRHRAMAAICDTQTHTHTATHTHKHTGKHTDLRTQKLFQKRVQRHASLLANHIMWVCQSDELELVQSN